MKNIKLALSGLLFGLTGLWLLAASWPEPATFIAIRNVLIQYSGVLGIGVMSVAMILATRPRWLEPWLGGLDKSYRLHKWLGISGLVIAIAHWLFAQGPKWLVQLGFMERPNRRGPPGDQMLGTIEQVFRDQRGLAESVGEWAFYATVLFLVLALVKRFPYRLFAKTHKWISVVYLVLVFHAIVLIKFSYWSQPVGWVTGLLMAGGFVSAWLVLLNRVGSGRQTQGSIASLHYFSEMGVLETVITLDEGWRGHQGGQFAFVTFEPKEGRHPFTIALAWNPQDRRIVFITKALGDYTKLLPERLNVGDKVSVEGPYGQFTFDDSKKRQIWIGGGIGITPFIARMKELSQLDHDEEIVLFHSAAKLEPEALGKLTADAEAADVQLHVLIDNKDQRLDSEKLKEAVPDWQFASIWFCGPAAFGTALRKDLVGSGLSPSDFHQELFNMR